MSKLTVDQLGRMFVKTFGVKKFSTCKEYDDIMEILFQDVHNFRPPCYITDTFVYSERVPIFAEDTWKSSSLLHQALADRDGEVALVADSILPSLKGLHLATLAGGMSKIHEWLSLSGVEKHDMYIKSLTGGDIIIISKLTAFIR